MQPTRTYGGLRAEERRGQRREQLLDAALDLVGAEGFGALSMRRVVAQAGLAPRYFYESFPGLEDLRLALYDLVTDELLNAALTAVQHATDAPAREVTRRGLAAMVDLLAADPRKGRVLSEAAGTPELAARRAQAAKRASGLLVAQAATRLEARSRARPVEFVARFLVAGFAETVSHWVQHPGEVTRDRVVDNCTALFLAAGAALDRLR